MIRSLITMRHSVTAHSRARIISGRLDEPLSETGRVLASNVPRISVDVVVTSPSRRAIETASLVTGRHPATIRSSSLCLERSYGELEGLHPDLVQKFRGRIRYLRVGEIDHSLDPPGGETFNEVHYRAKQFASFLCGLDAESVLVVSHEVFLQQLHRVLLDLDLPASLARDIRPLQTHGFTRDHFNGQWCETEDAAAPGVTDWIPW